LPSPTKNKKKIMLIHVYFLYWVQQNLGKQVFCSILFSKKVFAAVAEWLARVGASAQRGSYIFRDKKKFSMACVGSKRGKGNGSKVHYSGIVVK
jgi:hypothetical protein